MSISSFFNNLPSCSLKNKILIAERKTSSISEKNKIVNTAQIIINHFNELTHNHEKLRKRELTEFKEEIFILKKIKRIFLEATCLKSDFKELFANLNNLDLNLCCFLKIKERIQIQEIIKKRNINTLKTIIETSNWESTDIVEYTEKIIAGFGEFSTPILKILLSTYPYYFDLLFSTVCKSPLNHSITLFYTTFNNYEEEHCKKILNTLLSSFKFNEIYLLLKNVNVDSKFNKLIYLTIIKISHLKTNTKIDLISFFLDKFEKKISEYTYQYLMIELFDNRIKKIIIDLRYPYLVHSYLLNQACLDLINWIKTPINVHYTFLKSMEDPVNITEWAADYFLENYYKLVGSFQRPELFLDPFCFVHMYKISPLEGELLDCLYKSTNPEVIKRARLVLKKLEKFDLSIPKLFDHCDRLIAKGSSLNDIEEFLVRFLQKRNVKLKLPYLKPHKVSQKSLKLLSTINYPSIEKNSSKIASIKKLCFGSKDYFTEQLILSLQEIGWREGFEVEQIDDRNAWIRDVCFKLENDCLLIPQLKKKGKDFLPEVKILTSDFKNFNDLDPILCDHHMGQVYFHANLDQLSQKYTLKESRFYFEGGNLLKAKNCQGKSIILSGAMNILWSYIVAKQEGLFEHLDIKVKVDQKIETLETQGVFSEELIINTLKKLKLLNLPFDNPKNAKIVISQIEVIKECLAEDLGEEVLYLESGYGFNQNQTGLHIDMNMIPGDHGVIFIHDNAKSIEVLETVLKNKELRSFEQRRFEDYLFYSKKLYHRDGKRFLLLKKQLEENGFKVISIPGRYVTIDGEINYMNGIIGNGNLSDQFLITSGYRGIPKEEYLRDAVTIAFQSGGVDSVYFTGRTKNRYLDSEPIDFVTHYNLSAFGSIHCRTIEMS